MSDYGRINPTELDNWITGHYGEDQIQEDEDDPSDMGEGEDWGEDEEDEDADPETAS
jgi:hypothetical protein